MQMPAHVARNLEVLEIRAADNAAMAEELCASAEYALRLGKDANAALFAAAAEKHSEIVDSCCDKIGAIRSEWAGPYPYPVEAS